MEIASKRDGAQTFTIIKEHNIEEDDYRIQMLINNKIEGLIPLTLRKIDNKMELWYETTTMVSLENAHSKKLMSGEELALLIRNIKAIIDQLRVYLLTVDDIVFLNNMIFTNREEKKYWFCYCPGERGSFVKNIRKFFDDILVYINHNDKQAVMIAYGIQHITINEDFSIKDLLDCVNKASNEQQKMDMNDSLVSKEVEVRDDEKKPNLLKKILEKITGHYKYEITTEPTYVAENDFEYVTNGDEEDVTVLLSIPLVNKLVLRSINTEEEIIIRPNEFPCVIGNSIKSSDIHINSRVVSRVHIRIIEKKDGYYIEDLNSTNGTMLNDKKIKPHQLEKVEKGDVITIANLQFVVE